MAPRRFNAPFGERTRVARRDPALVSRGLLVESGPQHRARQALRAADHLSRTVVETLEEGVVVADARGRAVSFNQSALAILGLEADALSGHDPLLACGAALTTVDGDELTTVGSPLARVREGAGSARLTVRIARAGRERWVVVLVRPIGAPGGGAGGVVCTLNEITDAYEAERRLREERDRVTRFLEVAGTLIVVLDARGLVELVNPQGCELLGFAESELVGRDWFDTVVPSAERLHARMAFHRLVSGVEAPGASLETFLRTRDGDQRKVAWRHAVLRDADGQITSVLRSGEDVTERDRAEAQVAYLAYHDALTGLANRTLIEQQLDRDVARARRSSGAMALIEFDLDNFKLINDSFGHAAGDEVLRQTAERVDGICRGADVLARQGGDEFLLLLDCDDVVDAGVHAAAVGDRIASALSEPFLVAEAEFHVGASIGIAVFPDDATEPDTLLRRADAAMYQAKRSGGSSVARYEPEDEDARQRLAMTTRLRRAIAEGELRLHFQPIFRSDASDRDSARPVGLEALVRWEDPERGLVPPGLFIPIAEETGLIDELGDWVLDALCRQARLWDDAGICPQLTFNVSPRQLRRSGLAERIRATISGHGLSTGLFCVELTESAILSDSRTNGSTIDELRDIGVAVALDDFGAGHSSLARLRDLPVGMLKVDRSFLARVPADPQSKAIVAAILTLGRALGMTVVVEGVERIDQLAFLREHGSPLVQGFLLGRPVPAEALDLPIPWPAVTT